MTARLELGMPGSLGDVAGTQATGFHQANAGLFGALLRHGARGTVHLVRPSLQPRSPTEPAPPAPPRARKTAVVDVFAPLAGAQLPRCAAWHDVTGSSRTLYEWRALGLTGHAPFTFASHGFPLSEPDQVLRLLQLDVRPHDALICGTPSTRGVVEQVLERARELARSVGSPRRLPFRLDVVPHGVDVDRFRPADRGAARARLGLPAEAIVLLSLGRISPTWKGDLLPLLAVYRALVRERPALPLVLVIAGYVRPDERYYEALLRAYAAELELAPDRLRFAGEIAAADSPAWYAAADVFVGVTHFDNENFGLTAVEAMATGVPQVVTSWGGCRDTVVDGVTGFQIPTLAARCDRDLAGQPLWRPVDGWLVAGQAVGLDTRRFRERLLALVDSAALRRRMAVASRRRAVARYSWKPIVAQYEALWAELAARAARAPRRRVAAPVRPLSVFERARALASHELAAGAVVELSALGRRVLASELSVPIYLALEAVLATEPLHALLERLARGPAPVRALIRGRDRDRQLRHLLFALKHGYIELTGA